MTIVQVRPCRLDTDGVEQCSPENAEFFGVYVGTPGDFQWVADFEYYVHAKCWSSDLAELHEYEWDVTACES